MKTRKTITLSIAALLFILSCNRSYKVHTVIYPDGSCKRIFTLTSSDSIMDFYSQDHPIPIDSTWELVLHTDTNENGDTVIIHTATKHFENVGLLNKMYLNDTGVFRVIDRSVALKKQFRWFYTFLNYTETYLRSFDQPSLINNMDSVQYKYFKLDYDSQEKYLAEHFDSLEARQFDEQVEEIFFNWVRYTTIKSGFDAVGKSLDSLDSWSLDKNELEKRRDKILGRLSKDSTFLIVQSIWDILETEAGIDSLKLKQLEQVQVFKKFKEKYEFWEDRFWDSAYENKVEMPGLIIETSSGATIDKGQVIWNFNWIDCYTDDLVMHVQSRIVNLWAFWITGLILLILIIILWIGGKRKKP